MLHATESHLRRLGDEPLAIPDRVIGHIGTCRRCSARLAEIAADASRCDRVLGGPQPVPDADAGWARHLQEFRLAEAAGPRASRDPVVAHREGRRIHRISLRAGLVTGGVALVVAGTAAAATLTTVFAPTHVAPLTLTNSDVGALADFMGVGTVSAGQGAGARVLGGFSATSGSITTSFGTVSWTSTGTARVVSSLAAASDQAGFAVRLPTTLPSGVAGPQQIVVQPRVEVTVTFKQGVAGIGGSSVVLDAGPAVLVTYGSAGGPDIPTLGVLTMPRPVATSSGATTAQIAAYLLDKSGLPPDLVQEIRLLGDIGTTLPIPVPSGAQERSVDVAGSPGVLVTEPSNVASGVVWEDGSGILRAVAGLVSQQDVLGVADQLG